MSKENFNDNKQTDTRSDKLKLFSIGSVVLLAAIVILGNFLFDKIFGNALTFDFSDTAQNSITQPTEEYLNGLPQDAKIRVVGLFNRPDNVAGTYYQCIVPLLDDYVKKSGGRVSVEYVNPTEQPSIISSLDPMNSYDLASKEGCYVVQYNGRIKIIEPLDCYSYDLQMYYSTGNYYVNGNNTEFTFTNTMYSLTQGFTTKAYIVTGLKEETYVNLAKVLEAMSVDLAELQVSDNFAVPEDCDILILNGPNSDISEKMYVAITDYLTKGGKVYIAVDYSGLNVNEKYARLNKLINQMNINIDPLLISETDPGYQRNSSTVDTIVKANGTFAEYTTLPYFHSRYARNVRAIETPNSDWTTYNVLITSDKSSTLELDENGNAIEAGITIIGQHNVAMYSASNKSAGELFVFGTLAFSSDAYIDEYSLNDSNVDFFRGCVRELSDNATGTQLSIAAKSVDNFSIDPSKTTASTATLMLVIFMIVIPVILISMAVIVYTKRKNL